MSADDEVAIRVHNVSKTFKLPHERQTSLKSLFLNFYKKKRSYEEQRALTDISFEIKRGEFFGIVGRNGSGKSTLLKLLAGIYSPNKGHIAVYGKLTPFIELGVGFNPELTGRENVFLNGALLGFSRKEVEAMYDEIVQFAELERFMDQKLKNYSSGMQVRLAFSIAIRAQPDILVLDEVLAVGDAAFQKKCTDYFERLKRKGQTIVLVTHDMGVVRRYCSRALLVEDGQIKAVGSPDRIANQYTLDNVNAERAAAERESKKLGSHVKSLDIKLRSPKMVPNNEHLVFDVLYELYDDTQVDLGISVTFEGVSVVEHNTKDMELNHTPGVKHKVSYKLPLDVFNPGRFGVNVAIFERDGFKLAGFNSDACNFIIDTAGSSGGGLLTTKGEWVFG